MNALQLHTIYKMSEMYLYQTTNHNPDMKDQLDVQPTTDAGQHLAQAWSHLLAKEPNSSARTPGSIDEPAASSRLSLRLATTKKDSANHKRPPQGNSTIQLLPNNKSDWVEGSSNQST